MPTNKLHPFKLRTKLIKKNMKWKVADILTISMMSFALLALLLLVFFYVRPIKTADIKVPVATDRSSYIPGEKIGGVFFGETYFHGHVRILREVYCANYKGFITPTSGSAAGQYFDTIAQPRKLNGLTVSIGYLPTDVPIGANCIVKFTNIYDIKTPFGARTEMLDYYTQNFAIISPQRQMILKCQNSGQTSCDSDPSNNSSTTTTTTSVTNTNEMGGVDQPTTAAPSSSSTTTNNTTTNNTTNNPPAQSAPVVQQPQPGLVRRLLNSIF